MKLYAILLTMTFWVLLNYHFCVFDTPPKIRNKPTQIKKTENSPAHAPHTSSLQQTCQHTQGKIGILIVADSGAQQSYRPAIRSVQCYGAKHEYPVIVIDPNNATQVPADCNRYNRIMFKRHCIALQLIAQFDWIAGFDGDVGVVSSAKCLESLIKPGIDVVHEERFHNGEVQAGSYLIKNSDFGRQYLREWTEYEHALPSGFHNEDNGALHIHLLKNIAGNDTSIVDKCYAMWTQSVDLDSYDRYVGCCMQYISDARFHNKSPSKIRIIRRGQGFMRDLWVTRNLASPVDFFLHAMKDHVKFYDEQNESMDLCGTPAWMPMILPGKLISTTEMQAVITEADNTAKTTRPASIVNAALVSHCWPNCREYWNIIT